MSELHLGRTRVLNSDRYSFFCPDGRGWVIWDRMEKRQVDYRIEEQDAIRRWQELMGIEGL